MKIAFTSCMNIRQYKSQPVWQQISALQPEVLVLLGDSIYIDVPWPTINGNPIAANDANFSDLEFHTHVHQLYRDQLNEPNFNALIQQTPQTYAIWDDHDFLWNNAQGGSLSSNVYGGLIRSSRALFNTYRRALAGRDPAQFPSNPNDPSLWRQPEPAPSYNSVDLPDDVCLHFTDGRSYKDRHTLLGTNQRSMLLEAIQDRPEALHLIASGIVVTGSRREERWQAYEDDYTWLTEVAKTHQLMVLSGDVHENRFTPVHIKDQQSLYDITASGAAIRFPLRWPGQATENFAILDITATEVVVYQASGGAQPTVVARVSRQTWKAASA